MTKLKVSLIISLCFIFVVVFNATYTVTNTNDSGAGSLRQAITDANNNAGTDTINFSIAGGPPHTISPTSQLPTITEAVIIDAGTNHEIILNGSSAVNYGIYITSNGSTIKGLVINSFNNHGIRIFEGDYNVITGCYIGTDHTGTVDLGNSMKGLSMSNSDYNTIGGTTVNERNILSGNAHSGVLLYESHHNVIQGNYIGVDATGNNPMGNDSFGIEITRNSSYNIIGGTVPGSGNVISDSNWDGIKITYEGSDHNRILGNFIGTNASGDADLGNGASGISLSDYSGDGCPDFCIIGGDTPEARNIISGNNKDGIEMRYEGSDNNKILGNYIGTDATGTVAIGNTESGIRIYTGEYNIIGGTVPGARNIISGNGQYGINISDSGTNNNQVLGNYIGTDVNGTNDLGNSYSGIIIKVEAKSNTIGGTIAEARNIISGNNEYGILILGSGTDNNVVLGNYIGTDVNGTADLGNSWDGIRIGNGAEFNFIGGEISGSGNIISGNDMCGIQIYNSGTANNFIFGNYIGTDVNGTSNLGNLTKGIFIFNSAQSNTIGGTISGQSNIIAFNGDGGVVIEGDSTDYNRISGNSIFSNTGLGIDLDDDGVTPNDAGDVDTGPNENLNFPVITDIVQTGIDTYTINGTAAAGIEIELYIVNNSTAGVIEDPTGYGEGYEFLTLTTTDISGDFLVEGQVLQSDCILSSIAIDGDGNTSEFGPNLYIASNTLSVTITNSAPAAIMQDETDVLIANLDLSADSDNVIWTDLQVTATGSGIDADIIAIKVYADNGDVEFNSTTDTEIGTGTFTGGVADIDITDQNITSTSSVYFVTVDVTGAAEVIGNTCLISISNTTNFTICAPDTIEGFPSYNSGTITFTDNPDLVVVTPNDLAKGSTRAGTEDLIFEVLSIATQHDRAILTALDIDLIGTGDDNDISTVKVYLDDGDGDFSPADDSIIGTGTFTIKSVSIDITDQELSATAKIYYIVMDISEDAVNDHTIGIRCEDNSYFSITEPDTISNSEFPFESNLTTIKNYADTLDNMKVYPNPWKTGCSVEYISFVELTENVKIRIFNISGELVMETDADNQPEWFWHLKNQSGNRIASGVYLYVITNDQGEKKKGKIAVIK